jgi:hypothetical protein
MSIHEESTIVSEGPMMGGVQHLVMLDQDNPQNRLDTIVPDLALIGRGMAAMRLPSISTYARVREHAKKTNSSRGWER